MTLYERIDQLDLTVLGTIEGLLSQDDQRSLLALQGAVRQWKPGPYTVLEIGSYEGGSLQGYVADPACEHIVSIDLRPAHVPDERSELPIYSRVSAEDMLAKLAAVPGANISKVRTITASTETLNPADLGVRPDFCFVDGEHTDAAALRDARYCLATAGPDCAIAFHDGNVVYKGLQEFIAQLKSEGREFRAYNLASVVFVIELGQCRLSEVEPLRSWREQNYKGYLESLTRNDVFREIARRHDVVLRHPLVGLARKIGLVEVARKLVGLR